MVSVCLSVCLSVRPSVREGLFVLGKYFLRILGGWDQVIMRLTSLVTKHSVGFHQSSNLTKKHFNKSYQQIAGISKNSCMTIQVITHGYYIIALVTQKCDGIHMITIICSFMSLSLSLSYPHQSHQYVCHHYETGHVTSHDYFIIALVTHSCDAIPMNHYNMFFHIVVTFNVISTLVTIIVERQTRSREGQRNQQLTTDSGLNTQYIEH